MFSKLSPVHSQGDCRQMQNTGFYRDISTTQKTLAVPPRRQLWDTKPSEGLRPTYPCGGARCRAGIEERHPGGEAARAGPGAQAAEVKWSSRDKQGAGRSAPVQSPGRGAGHVVGTGGLG